MSSKNTPQSTTPLKPKKQQLHSQSPNPYTTQTPDKHHPSPLPRRSRNRGVALSINEVRKIAQSNPHHHNQTLPIKSARKKILSCPSPLPQISKSANVAVSGPTKLPENYEMLGEFYDCLDSSIRLLRLKGSMSSFTNISPKIECLTDRRFSHKHLAQLKFILPEAIEIKKVLIFDERSSCMKPDLHVTVNVDAFECEGKLKSENKNLHLRKVFRDRLVDFHKAHPKGDEVPEETLPEPFNRSQKSMHSNIITTTASLSSAVETSTEALENQQPAVASHLSRSFLRRFSQKVINNEAEKTDRKSSMVSVLPVAESCLNKNSSNVEPSSSAAPSPTKLSTTCPPATPIKEIGIMKSEDGSPTKIDTIHSTPAKLASTPARLMTATPASHHPPKRCYMSPNEDSTSSPNKLVRRPPRSRSLKFDTPVKNKKLEIEVNEVEGVSVDDNDHDDDDILPEDLLQSIREKERKAIEERDPAISQAKRRRQMIAFLPKIFNMIHFFFQSIKRSIITKEELIHKIIASHCDIVDRREVEEQLNLLLELVPEWISEKLASSGDLLVCINKMSSAESIRARLAEAK